MLRAVYQHDSSGILHQITLKKCLSIVSIFVYLCSIDILDYLLELLLGTFEGEVT